MNKPIQKWEYFVKEISSANVFCFGSFEMDEFKLEQFEWQLDLNDGLSMLGKHGWELIQVVNETYIFKRPIVE